MRRSSLPLFAVPVVAFVACNGPAPQGPVAAHVPSVAPSSVASAASQSDAGGSESEILGTEVVASRRSLPLGGTACSRGAVIGADGGVLMVRSANTIFAIFPDGSTFAADLACNRLYRTSDAVWCILQAPTFDDPSRTPVESFYAYTTDGGRVWRAASWKDATPWLGRQRPRDASGNEQLPVLRPQTVSEAGEALMVLPVAGDRVWRVQRSGSTSFLFSTVGSSVRVAAVQNLGFFSQERMCVVDADSSFACLARAAQDWEHHARPAVPTHWLAGVGGWTSSNWWADAGGGHLYLSRSDPSRWVEVAQGYAPSLPGQGSNGFASPVRADGSIYAVGFRDRALVLDLDNSGQIRASIPMPAPGYNSLRMDDREVLIGTDVGVYRLNGQRKFERILPGCASSP